MLGAGAKRGHTMSKDRIREKAFAAAVIAIASLFLARSIRAGWMALCGGACVPSPVMTFPTTAPEAYRVGVPFAIHVVTLLLHLHDTTYANALIDFVCCFAALYGLSCLAVQGLVSDARRLTLVLFLALMQFPLAWVVFQQRPETLPTALFVAAALLCVSNGNGSLWTACLLLAALLQAFVRADVPFLFGVALVLVGAFYRGFSLTNVLRGAAVAFIAGGVQACLQFVWFPHLPYETGSPVMLRQNLQADHLSAFVVALLPFLCMAFLVKRFRRQLSETDVLAIVASLLYLPLWFTVGVVQEVRIFVPFLLALCVVGARVSSRLLLPEPD
jgi:hypothetical protein